MLLPNSPSFKSRFSLDTLSEVLIECYDFVWDNTYGSGEAGPFANYPWANPDMFDEDSTLKINPETIINRIPPSKLQKFINLLWGYYDFQIDTDDDEGDAHCELLENIIKLTHKHW